MPGDNIFARESDLAAHRARNIAPSAASIWNIWSSSASGAPTSLCNELIDVTDRSFEVFNSVNELGQKCSYL